MNLKCSWLSTALYRSTWVTKRRSCLLKPWSSSVSLALNCGSQAQCGSEGMQSPRIRRSNNRIPVATMCLLVLLPIIRTTLKMFSRHLETDTRSVTDLLRMKRRKSHRDKYWWASNWSRDKCKASRRLLVFSSIAQVNKMISIRKHWHSLLYLILNRINQTLAITLEWSMKR